MVSQGNAWLLHQMYAKQTCYATGKSMEGGTVVFLTLLLLFPWILSQHASN